MKEGLIQIQDAAGRLGVTRQAVYKRLSSLGEKPIKVGGKSFVDAETFKNLEQKPKLQPKGDSGDSDKGGDTRSVDNVGLETVVKLLQEQVSDLRLDKVTARQQVDSLQRQVETKDQHISQLLETQKHTNILLAGYQQKQGMLDVKKDVDPVDVEIVEETEDRPKKTTKKQKKKDKNKAKKEIKGKKRVVPKQDTKKGKGKKKDKSKKNKKGFLKSVGDFFVG